MVIECDQCNCKVKAKYLSSHEEDLVTTGERCRFTFLVCPSCKGALVACEDLIVTGPSKDDHEWAEPRRVWPREETNFDLSIPAIVRTSLVEARICFQAGSFLASAVMCGRALEGVCSEFGAKHQALVGGLSELLERGIIDKKLHQWGQETRRLRNIAAHASDETVSKDDAQDLLDFTRATCEYVFVLTKKYEEFMKRAEKKKKDKDRDKDKEKKEGPA